MLRPDAGRSECKFRQVSVTRVYLRLRHTTSLIRPPRGLNKKASEKVSFIYYMSHLQDFLGAFFKHKIRYVMVSKKNNPLFV